MYLSGTRGENHWNPIEKLFKGRALREIKVDQLWLIDQFFRRIDMKTWILEAEDIVWSLDRHYLCILKNYSFSYLIDQKPHIAIGNILKPVNPFHRLKRIGDIINSRMDNNFDEKHFGGFMSEPARKSK